MTEAEQENAGEAGQKKRLTRRGAIIGGAEIALLIRERVFVHFHGCFHDRRLRCFHNASLFRTTLADQDEAHHPSNDQYPYCFFHMPVLLFSLAYLSKDHFPDAILEKKSLFLEI